MKLEAKVVLPLAASALVATFLVRVGGQGLCPPGIETCDDEKCKPGSGGETCCKCFLWRPTGKCAPDGWRRVSGPGDCKFDVTPPSRASSRRDPTKCPPGGVQCEHEKCSGTGTCCRCGMWEADGTCMEEGWKVIKGSGSCDFPVEPPPPPGTPRDSTKCPLGVQCEHEKCSGTGTCCRCGMWEADGTCMEEGWKVIKGSGSCAFKVEPPPPPGAPRDPTKCPPGGVECEYEKCSGTGTCCRCSLWKADGTCMEEGWKAYKGSGSCAFKVEPPPPPGAPRDPTKCPPGGLQCEYEKCSGTGTCCRCSLWEANGTCMESGWKVYRGSGSCDFKVDPP